MEKYTSFWLLQFLNFFTYFNSRLPDGLLIPEKEVLCYTKGTHASDNLCSYSLVTNSMVENLRVTQLTTEIFIPKSSSHSYTVSVTCS